LSLLWQVFFNNCLNVLVNIRQFTFLLLEIKLHLWQNKAVTRLGAGRSTLLIPEGQNTFLFSSVPPYRLCGRS
jgi:hypothetical protein